MVHTIQTVLEAVNHCRVEKPQWNGKSENRNILFNSGFRNLFKATMHIPSYQTTLSQFGFGLKITDDRKLQTETI